VGPEQKVQDRICVNDLQVWNLGSEYLKSLLAGLTEESRLALLSLMAEYRRTKEAIAAVVSDVDADSICCECMGQCCLNGKFRINVFDALARLTEQIPTSADFFRKPLCPYGNESGCTMEPGLRPADCILFICDLIDEKLSPQTRLSLGAWEHCLRTCIQNASGLTGQPLGTPLLLWAEKKQLIQEGRDNGND
jgi:hypothetical protein